MIETKSTSYDPLASVYDRYWGRDTQHLLSTIGELVLDGQPPPARVLDLCCGTGQLDRALNERGYEVVGVDGSPEMVRFARTNAPACEFVVADARDFSVPGSFDLALCMYDSLNHLMTAEDLRQAFEAVRATLRPGAPFLFDLNMEEGYRERWRGSFGFVEEDHVCVVRSRFDEHEGTGSLVATMMRREPGASDDGGWTRSDVTLTQRCYGADEVVGLLETAGFSDVRVFDGLRDLGLKRHVGRSYFLCRA